MSDNKNALQKQQDSTELLSSLPDYLVRDSGRPGYPYTDVEMGESSGFNVAIVRWALRAVLRRKWMILLLVVLVTSGVTLEIFRMKSRFQASTLVEVGKENTSVVRTSNQDLIIQNEDTLKTKMLLLQSKPLIEDVIVSLKLDQNPDFMEQGKKSYRQAVNSLIYRITAGHEEPVAVIPPDLAGLQVVEPRQRSVEEIDRLAPFVRRIEENVDVSEVNGTRLLKISYVHPDPAIATSVSNAIAQVLLLRTSESRTDRLSAASNWLDRTTQNLKNRVAEAEKALADYTRDHGIYTTRDDDTLTTDKLVKLHTQAMEAESNRILKESLYQEIKAGRTDQIPETFNDLKLTTLKRELIDLNAKSAQLNLEFGPSHPEVIKVKQQIAFTQQQIEAALHNLEEVFKTDFERAVRNEQSFKVALDQAKAEATEENHASIRYNILKEEVNTATSVYKNFLERTNQADIEVSQQQQNNLRVFLPARIPREAVSPNRKLVIFLGMVLSLAVGIGLALFLESIDETINNVEDVARYTQLPALGVIPVISGSSQSQLSAKKKRKLNPVSIAGSTAIDAEDNDQALVPVSFPIQEDRSPGAEAYRLLRTSVILSTAAEACKTILVTSSRPGEGKTTVCINMAISLAQLGESVLIIDCDMRTPKVHEVFNLDPAQQLGLSTYLAHDVDVHRLIKKLPIPGLSLLPSGPIPRNPVDLISSVKMKNMLLTLAEHYDHILIDSPPLINLADPVILSTLADGVVLVVCGGKTKRDVVQHSYQELANVGAKVFGVVLNKADIRYHDYGGHTYGAESAV